MNNLREIKCKLLIAFFGRYSVYVINKDEKVQLEPL